MYETLKVLSKTKEYMCQVKMLTVFPQKEIKLAVEEIRLLYYFCEDVNKIVHLYLCDIRTIIALNFFFLSAFAAHMDFIYARMCQYYHISHIKYVPFNILSII